MLENVHYPNPLFTLVSRDFKQRQLGRRRERHKARENPKGPLRMTIGKRVNVLRSVPTWVELISRCLKTWGFAFVYSAVLALNFPWNLSRGNLIACFLLLCKIFQKDRESWSELKPVGEHVSTVKCLFEKWCKQRQLTRISIELFPFKKYSNVNSLIWWNSNTIKPQFKR